ncbi:MAG: ATP-binding protein [Theionarchaea archaeon]|nr:ATP-binding protein [Theionarchaea archaeon]
MSITMGRGVQKFWNLNCDPFSELPLQFRNPDDYSFLVKTSNINSMNNIYSGMENDSVSKIYMVLGERGCGKSTAQHYLYTLVEQTKFKKNHFPVFCGINLDETDFNAIRLSIHYSILNSLIESILEDEELARNVNIERSQRINDSREFLPIETEIKRLIRKIHQIYKKISIFIDDLDKIDIRNYSLCERYFKTTQSFYTELCSYPTFIFIAMLPYFGKRFETSEELSYLGKKGVEMKPWNKTELDSLLSKRLESAYEGFGKFHLSNIFDNESLDMIFEKNEMLPRYVMNSCRRLMQKAYEASEIDEPKIAIPCKPIKKIFCNYFSELIKGYGVSEFISFKHIHGIVLQRHRRAYDLIKRCMSRNENIVYKIIDGTFSVWKNNSFHDKETLMIIEKFNIVHSYRTKKEVKYEVESIIDELLTYLYNTLDSYDESVKYYFIESRLHTNY